MWFRDGGFSLPVRLLGSRVWAVLEPLRLRRKFGETQMECQPGAQVSGLYPLEGKTLGFRALVSGLLEIGDPMRRPTRSDCLCPDQVLFQGPRADPS